MTKPNKITSLGLLAVFLSILMLAALSYEFNRRLPEKTFFGEIPLEGMNRDEVLEKVVAEVEKDVDDSSDPAVEVTEPVLEEPEEVSEPVVEEPEEVAPVVKSFNITAKKFEFTPSSITVNEGDIVRITISSSDVSHGFSIPQFGVSKIIPAGGTVTVEFTADKKGSYKFFCIVFCGSGHGSMRGTLVVQ